MAEAVKPKADDIEDLSAMDVFRQNYTALKGLRKQKAYDTDPKGYEKAAELTARAVEAVVIESVSRAGSVQLSEVVNAMAQNSALYKAVARERDSIPNQNPEAVVIDQLLDEGATRYSEKRRKKPVVQ